MGLPLISKRLQRMDRLVAQFTGPRVIRIMNETAREVRDYIKSRYMGGGRTSPNRLARNTGEMERKTVARRAETTDGKTKAVVAINVPYASVHFGEGGKLATVIRPKKGKALAIPLAAVRGPNQRPVLPAGSSQITKKFSFKGILYGALPGQKTKPLFALRSSVTVPVRVQVERDIQPFATQTMQDKLKREIVKLFGEQ
jgi:phage gpG-like protein